MNGISLLVVITPRDQAERFITFLQSKKVCAIFTVLCNGTAGQSIMDILGLEDTEKMLIWTAVEHQKADRLMQKMVSSLGINMPGTGIALSLPMGSIGGASSMKYFLEKQHIIIGEVTQMEEKQCFPYDLIVAITERGSVDSVMDAAHSAGARGGTVIHAKGMGTDFTEKFFGVSLATEKDIVLIVTKGKDKSAIMRAIMEKAGISTEAHTTLFSMPVESVVGLTSVMQQDPADEDDNA